jgi:hypothetical protein
MKLVMDAAKAVAVDMSVVLCSSDGGVAEKLLHGAQVSAAGEKMGRETMAQRMRADAGIQTGPPNVFLHENPEHLPREGSAAATHENCGDFGARARQLRPKLGEILAESFQSWFTQWNDSLLTPLPRAAKESRIDM